MAKDVEMADAAAPAPAAADDDKDKAPVPFDVAQGIAKNVGFVRKAVEGAQPRLLARALRNTTPVRRKCVAADLANALRAHLPSDSRVLRDAALSALGSVDNGDAAMTDADEVPDDAPVEVEVYLAFLVVAFLVREKRYEDATKLCEASLPRLRTMMRERRAVDALAAKFYFYLALCHEKLGTSANVAATLFAAHRTAVLQHADVSAATLLNALLRGLLAANRVEAALKLVSKTDFPESASNPQFCRYLYYTGRIQALQLDYTDAHTKLMQSQRKAPATTAVGFRVEIQKLAVLVQLLMGEVPDRSSFEGFKGRALEPYLQLTRAVRRGDLPAYRACVAEHADQFDRDRTRSLVARLERNVVKTGLRRLNVSYSRISLDDVRARLHLDSAASAEFVCAKAIKDGVIDAVIDHDNQQIRSKGVADVYSTNEPQKAFHRRIVFCLDVRNEAVKAMQYPPDTGKKKQPDEDDKEEKQTDEEIAKEIEEELGDELP